MSKIIDDSLFEDTGLGDTLVEEQDQEIVEEQDQEIVEQIEGEQQIVIAEDKVATEQVGIMAMKINPPRLDKCKNYAAYKNELDGWREITSTEKKSQGYAVALSLPYEGDGDGSDIRSLVFEQ